MLEIHNVLTMCTILSYTSFVTNEKKDMNFCTTVEKFSQDMKKLIDEGYECVSLETCYRMQQSKIAFQKKCFCIVFQGGYDDNYSLIFPLIKALNLQVSVFVATDLVGINKLEDNINYIPHFGWSEAQEMVDSGLVKMYPMWHPMDYGKDFYEEMQNKIKLINSRIEGNNANFALSYSNISDKELSILNQLGVKIKLTNFSHLSSGWEEKGLIPAITVNYTSDVIDTIEQYIHLISEELKKTLPAANSSINSIATDDVPLQASISLPIDRNPIIRNYLRHAFALSIIQAHRIDRAERIVLSDYIDVVFKPAYNVFDFHTYGCENMRGLDCLRITKEFFDVNPIDVNTVIINGLKIGYYSDLWLDTYYIQGKPGYNIYHATHGILIYEYNSENKSYSALSYASDGRYRELIVPIDAVNSGCSNCNFTHLNMLKTKKEVIVEYDIKDLKIKLLNYLNSVCFDDNARFNKKGVTQYYNYEASLRFSECVASMCESNKSIHLTSLYSFAEQKKTMAWRIQYIADKEKIEIENLAVRVNELIKKSEMVFNYGIKYNFTKSKKVHMSLVSTVDFLNKEEETLLSDLLSKL